MVTGIGARSTVPVPRMLSGRNPLTASIVAYEAIRYRDHRAGLRHPEFAG